MKIKTAIGITLLILLLGGFPNIVLAIAEPATNVFFYPEDPCQLNNDCHWVKEMGFIGMLTWPLSLLLAGAFNLINGIVLLFKLINKRDKNV